jgi:hypothetical protein
VKRDTHSFQAEPDVHSLLGKGVNRLVRARIKSGISKDRAKLGAKTRIINEAIRLYLSDLRGKREAL